MIDAFRKEIPAPLTAAVSILKGENSLPLFVISEMPVSTFGEKAKVERLPRLPLAAKLFNTRAGKGN